MPDLKSEILEVTRAIQKRHPELYALLSETPLFFTGDELKIDQNDYRKYLDSIKHQLAEAEKGQKTTND